jgi:hypothetical protein
MEIIRRLTRRSVSLQRAVTVITATLISVVSVTVIYTNRAGIEYTRDSFNGFKVDREIFEAATRRGLLGSSFNNGVLLSSTYDPALWMNKEYVSWLGGPSIKSFGRPQQMITCQLSGEELCMSENGGMLLIETTRDERATAVVVTLHKWWAVPRFEEEIELVEAISSRREDLLCGQSEAEYSSGWWTTKCLTIDETLLQNIQSHYAS